MITSPYNKLRKKLFLLSLVIKICDTTLWEFKYE